LYCWTFNFHKVVRQHNSGAVEDNILPCSAVYLRIQKWKNYWNRSTFAKVIVKIKVARFYGPRCSFGLGLGLNILGFASNTQCPLQRGGRIKQVKYIIWPKKCLSSQLSMHLAYLLTELTMNNWTWASVVFLLLKQSRFWYWSLVFFPWLTQ